MTSPEWWRTALGEGREPSADQIEAITARHTGRRAVDAGAGTGKTSTLALRALYLIESEHVRADQIVVVTFTRKAAAEIGSRIADTLDRAIASGARFKLDGRGVRCTTIHGLASDIRSEFAFDLSFEAPPVAIGDGEAHAIFSGAFRALLDGRLGVDATAFPLGEINLAQLERDLGKLALKLKNHGVSPELFETRALAEAQRFDGQRWGQLYSPGKREGSRIAVEPKVAVTGEALACEAERERRNIRVVAALFHEFDRRLRERGAATYGDLIGATTSALQARPDILARLRARWRYVLLDESQDTSDLQLAFLETLFGKPGEPDAAGMMPVGDRRQAIYGFNGADEHVMQRLAAVADATHPLVVNRRSFQEIVDVGHAVLESAGIVDEKTPKLVAANGSGALDCVRLQNFGAEKQSIKERVVLEAGAIACEVRRLLGDGATQASDIAILVRRRTHAAVYVRELNRRGIGAALDRRSGLFVADEIRDVLAWMTLLVDLHDGQALVRVLQSPLCGLGDATMIALAAAHSWVDRILRDDVREPESTGDAAAPVIGADVRERLARFRELLIAILPCASLPLSQAMAQMLRTLPIAASYVRLAEREGAPAIGAQAIVNLASFETLAREFAAEHPAARVREFTEDVARRILYDDDVQEAELDLDGVRVLTIHQAKGLEWPYVFVACSTKHQYGYSEPTDRVVNYDLSSGAFALKNDVDGRETFRWLCLSQEHDPADGRRLDPAPRKVAAVREQARVFYVALTRAKKRVYVTAPASTPENGKGGGEAPFLQSIREWARAHDANVNLEFHTEVTAVSLSGNGHGGRAPAPVARTAAPAAMSASTFRPRISFTSISAFETCPRQARYRYRLLLPDLREARPRFVGLDGNETPLTTNAAALGSLVHRALEHWGRAQIESRRASLGRNGSATALPFGDAFEVAKGEFADVAPGDASSARRSGEYAVRELTGYTLLAVEEPFELVTGETVVIGAVDLIARAPDRAVVVVDYKTGVIPREKYALQLELYRRVAQERYAPERIRAAILRLTPTGATFEEAQPQRADVVDRHIAEVGQLTSDTPKVGDWCRSCAYRGSPCREGTSVVTYGVKA